MDAALKIISFNLKRTMRFHTPNSWYRRRELVARVIEESGASIVGVQEMLPAMKEDIRRLLADYRIFGWGRTRRQTGEHSAILVHAPDLHTTYDETFWLSKHPNKWGSRAYFAMFPRICTVCEVYSEELQRKIRVFNTHFDHICGPARTLGVHIILDYMHRYNLREKMPTILMGDLNARPNSKAVKILTNNLHPYADIHLTSVYSRFDKNRIYNSYHAFRGKCKGNRPIDYIFVSDDFQIEEAYMDTSNLDGRYPSDHFPLVAVLALKKDGKAAAAMG